MKKVLALVMCVAMIACFAVIASADTDTTFTVATVEGNKGDKVVIAIDITAGSKLGALGLQVSYDKTYLKPVMSDDEGDEADVLAGDATSKALVTGNIEKDPIEIAIATEKGIKNAGSVASITFEVIEEIPEGTTAVVSVAVTTSESADDPDEKYNFTTVDGGVKAPAKPESKPESKPDEKPESKPEEKPVEESKVEPTPVEDVTKTEPKNPKTGDASALAVAAGLCAVMAAAFVITKKVNG